ncbi:MAG: glycoside hydrolase family 5 protein [Ruminococcus sp.]|uniref:glycoside hydrolase family 5 protein n=1 Tax=Ruminococcus sp. TaxID=41978 RepID=UPI0025D381F1|nr:glycoside hydrolase family 5 protein [Ruminococcus sp.]MCR5542300.1 glycoside hydrolase family 5 protein [Ruminococcus sp.]
MLNKLKVINGKLTDGEKPIRLFGLSTHGIAWYPEYVCEESFAALKNDWHTNCVRITMYTDEFRGYCKDGNKQHLKELVEKGVNIAEKLDMYVIVDWHVLSDQDPMKYIDQAEEFFGDMSKRFAEKNNVIYEICNEPNNSGTWEKVTEYADRIIPLIRQNSPDALVITGTPNWSQDIHCALDKPFKWDNVMYSLHFYAATHKGTLRSRLERCVEAGLPVFINEFNLCEASGKGDIDHDESEAWREVIDRLDLSCICWCLSNSGDTCGVFAKDCTKLSGWTDDDLKNSGLIIKSWFSKFADEENDR